MKLLRSSAMFLFMALLICSQGEESFAAIVDFSINQTFSQGVSLADLPQTAINIGDSNIFFVDPGISNLYFDFMFPGSGTFSTINTKIYGYYFLRSYSKGATIDATNFGNNESVISDWDTILVNNMTAGVWGSSNNGYLGFVNDNNSFGWIEYNFTRIGQVSTLTMLNGAYNDVAGDSIIAGASSASTPEPSTMLLMGLGAAGTAFIRRRKAKTLV